MPPATVLELGEVEANGLPGTQDVRIPRSPEAGAILCRDPEEQFFVRTKDPAVLYDGAVGKDFYKKCGF